MANSVQLLQTSARSLSKYASVAKKVLIYRNMGGLGDILMHRMLFKNIKDIDPECELYFACPSIFHDAAEGHSYIDHVIPITDLDLDDYGVAYNTTGYCHRHEVAAGKQAYMHRSDIWAKGIGIELVDHSMYLEIPPEDDEFAKKILKKEKPIVLVAPLSAIKTKNLNKGQLKPIIDELKKDYQIVGIHKDDNEIFNECNINLIKNVTIKQWMAIINNVDYVLSVDTAAFHCAGGLGKPVVGVFTWADGYVYGKYYDKKVIVQKHWKYDANWTCGPCYDHLRLCPFKTAVKPCQSLLTSNEILDGFYQLVEKYK